MTGMAISAVLALAGHPLLGLAAAFVGGILAGGITGLLHTRLKIQPILAGILTMTGLYSVNLRIMSGKPNRRGAGGSANGIFENSAGLVAAGHGG